MRLRSSLMLLLATAGGGAAPAAQAKPSATALKTDS